MKLYLEHESNDNKTIHFFYNFEEFKYIVEQEKINLDEWYVNCPNDTNPLYKILFDEFEITTDDLQKFYHCIETYDEDELLKIVMYLDYGYGTENLNRFDFDNAIDSIIYYESNTLFEVAQELYEMGVYPEVPDWLNNDMEKIYKIIEEKIEPNFNEFRIKNKTYWYEYNA